MSFSDDFLEIRNNRLTPDAVACMIRMKSIVHKLLGITLLINELIVKVNPNHLLTVSECFSDLINKNK